MTDPARRPHPFPAADTTHPGNSEKMTAVEIDHVNLRRVFDVRVNVEDRDRRDVAADIEKALKEVQTPDGIRIEVESGK
jgi:hypothetical protein